MTYAFLILLAASGAGSTILLALWKSTALREQTEKAGREEALRELAATRAALSLSETSRAEGVAHLEAVVANLKKEITALEADLRTCASPGAVRQRLRELLAPLPAAAPAVIVPAYGGLPR